jgi:hypothetical protein
MLGEKSVDNFGRMGPPGQAVTNCPIVSFDSYDGKIAVGHHASGESYRAGKRD